MTAGPDIGTKSILDLSGDNIKGMIVQDVNTGDDKVRQVIFESKFDQIQSEIELVYRDPKKHEISDHLLANSPEAPKKKGKVAILNLDNL